MDAQQVIVRPLHTEKSVDDMGEANVYHFEVHPRATKGLIRQSIEELFPGVRVIDVRTLNVKPKLRRVRWNIGKTKAWKKAMVRLRDGDNIDIGY